MSQATLPPETGDKSVLTYSALNTFRNCPRKYKHRYIDNLRPRAKVESLSFGSVIHSAIEIWYRSVNDANRLWKVLDFIERSFPERATDESQMANWHLARAMFTGYASRYPTEDFTIVEVEKTFTGQIRNPDTGRCSQTFVMAGKADAIVKRDDGMYLLEHKTAASIDGNYLDKLWTDTQIALYSYYLRELGYPIVGIIYNVLLKSRLKQSPGETQEEYEARHAELAAKNKSGKSTAKRQMPEKRFLIELREVSGSADPMSRTWRARYRVLKPETASLPLGSIVRVRLKLSDVDPYLKRVPIAAIDERGDQPRVWLLEEGKANPHSVEIVEYNGEYCKIRSQLPDGAPVISMGTHLLEKGMFVEAIQQ